MLLTFKNLGCMRYNVYIGTILLYSLFFLGCNMVSKNNCHKSELCQNLLSITLSHDSGKFKIVDGMGGMTIAGKLHVTIKNISGKEITITNREKYYEPDFFTIVAINTNQRAVFKPVFIKALKLMSSGDASDFQSRLGKLLKITLLPGECYRFSIDLAQGYFFSNNITNWEEAEITIAYEAGKSAEEHLHHKIVSNKLLLSR